MPCLMSKRPTQDPKAAADLVWQAYRQADLEQMTALAARAIEAHPQHGGCWFAYGCVHERLGNLVTADKAFAAAHRAKKDPVGLPCRVSWARFERAVEAGKDRLPAPLRTALEEVTLVLADYAEPILLEDHEDAELLGLFSGTPKSEVESGGNLSPMIHIFRRAHEHSSSSMKEFDAEVATTLVHEFGHYLGYDEDDLERLGLG